MGSLDLLPEPRRPDTSARVYAIARIGAGVSQQRPRVPGAGQLALLYWPQAGLVIPWPEGLSPRDAVLTWARQEQATDTGTSGVPSEA